MLVTREGIRRDIPHEDGQWMEFCKLSHVQMKKARKVAEKENREVIRELGAEILKALQTEDGEKRAKKLLAEQQYDPRAFDAPTLLGMGIVAWSYTDEFNADDVTDLDEETTAWAVETLIGLNRPRSLDDPEEKKDS